MPNHMRQYRLMFALILHDSSYSCFSRSGTFWMETASEWNACELHRDIGKGPRDCGHRKGLYCKCRGVGALGVRRTGNWFGTQHRKTRAGLDELAAPAGLISCGRLKLPVCEARA